jgi:hypothetical protein
VVKRPLLQVFECKEESTTLGQWGMFRSGGNVTLQRCCHAVVLPVADHIEWNICAKHGSLQHAYSVILLLVVECHLRAPVWHDRVNALAGMATDTNTGITIARGNTEY